MRDDTRRDGVGERSRRVPAPWPSLAGAHRFVLTPRNGMLVAVVLLASWILLGTIGFVAIEGYGVLDAFYMTVITLSTVGYREVEPLSAAGKVFASGLIIVGIGTVFYALVRIGRAVVEGELLDLMGRRRVLMELERLNDHYILCGYGRTARPVVEGLKDEGIPFCVVERAPELEADVQAEDVPYVLGDATDEEVLAQAGIARAKGVLALLPSDADNLYLTITAKGLNPQAKVIARATDEKAEVKLRRGGADDVVSPYKMASHRVIQAAVRPTVLEFMELVTGRQYLQLSLEEIPVRAGSDLAGRTIADARIRQRCGAIIVAIQRQDGEMMFNPGPDVTMEEGHLLLALGEQEDLRKLEGLSGRS